MGKPVTHIIRAATAMDASAIQVLFENAIRSAAWLSTAERSHTDFSAASEDERVFVCVDEAGQMMGFISVYEAASFIHHLFVAPAFHRQGVGRALLQSLEGWLAKPWQLKCKVANDNAIRFYESLGWTKGEPVTSEGGPYVLFSRDN